MKLFLPLPPYPACAWRRAREEESGTVVEINRGKIARVEEAGLPAGTSITVRDLFFNVPARKKFLKIRVDRVVAHCVAGHPLRAGAS